MKDATLERGEEIEESQIAERLPEQDILFQSVMETMVPKLVAEDTPLPNSLLSDVFPSVTYQPAGMEALRKEITNVCQEMYLVFSNEEEDDQGSAWAEKVGIDWILLILQLRKSFQL